jgi:hypothetical protein
MLANCSKYRYFDQLSKYRYLLQQTSIWPITPTRSSSFAHFNQRVVVENFALFHKKIYYFSFDFLDDIFGFYVKLGVKATLSEIIQKLVSSDKFDQAVAINETRIGFLYGNPTKLTCQLDFYWGDMIDNYQKIEHILSQNSISYDLLYLIKILIAENQIICSDGGDVDKFVLWITIYFLQNCQQKILPPINLFYKDGRTFDYCAQYESSEVNDVTQLFIDFLYYYQSFSFNQLVWPAVDYNKPVKKHGQENTIVRIYDQLNNQLLEISLEFGQKLNLLFANVVKLFDQHSKGKNSSILKYLIKNIDLIEHNGSEIFLSESKLVKISNENNMKEKKNKIQVKVCSLNKYNLSRKLYL